MADGGLLHLRDTYPIETAWAPPYMGDELRQVRAAAWDARLAGLRPAAAERNGNHKQASSQRVLAASYQTMHDAYREREGVFAAVMADRAGWVAATRAAQRRGFADRLAERQSLARPWAAARMHLPVDTGPGVTPKGITDTIIAVLNTVRPLAGTRHTRDEDAPPDDSRTRRRGLSQAATT